MKTDRELLDLAAKAAGYEAGNFEADGIYIWPPGEADQIRLWRPLADDGEALRLAVVVEAEIAPNCYIGGGVEVYLEHHNPVREMYADHGGDKFAATRRAIVRAAAKIGEQS